MKQTNRSSLLSGMFLIIIGCYFLLTKYFPALPKPIPEALTWPWFIIIGACMLLLIGLLAGNSHLIVPAFVIGGIGGILYFQNLWNDWTIWYYSWTLIPGFVGLGLIFTGLIRRKWKQLKVGARDILVSAFLFVIFSAIFSTSYFIEQWWPGLIVLIGIYIVITPWLDSLIKPKSE